MVSVVCPSCENQLKIKLTAKNGRRTAKCAGCQAILEFELFRIRAKRSRGCRDLTSSREFDVRVIDGFGKEQLIQFTHADNDDFEMRAQDECIFVWRNGAVDAVINLTIGSWYKVHHLNEPRAWLLAIVIVTVLLLGLTLMTIYMHPH